MIDRIDRLGTPAAPPTFKKYSFAFTFVIAVIIFAGIYSYNAEVDELENEAKQALLTSAGVKQEQIEDWSEECFSELNITISLPGLKEIIQTQQLSKITKPTYFRALNTIITSGKFLMIGYLAPNLDTVYTFPSNVLSERENRFIRSSVSAAEDSSLFALGDSNTVTKFIFIRKIVDAKGKVHTYFTAVSAQTRFSEILNSRSSLPFKIHYSLGSRLAEQLFFVHDNDVPFSLSDSFYHAVRNLNQFKVHSHSSTVKHIDIHSDFVTIETEYGNRLFIYLSAVFHPHSQLITYATEEEAMHGAAERLTVTVVTIALVGVIMLGLLLLVGIQEKRSYENMLLSHAEDRAALEKHYRYLIRYANDIIFLLDKNFIIKEMNERAIETYQYMREELAGKHLTSILESNDMTFPVLYQKDKGLFRSVHCKKDGTRFNVEVSVNSFSAGEKNYIQLIIRDITEQVNFEQALQYSEEQFRHLANNASDIIYKISMMPSPKFIFVSKIVEELTGYSPEEHYQDPQIADKIVHPEDKSLLREAMQNAISPLEIRWVKKSGEILWTEQRFTITKNDQGEIVEIQGISRDITQRKKSEIQKEITIRFNLLKSAANEILLFSNSAESLFTAVCDVAVTEGKCYIAGIISFISESDQKDILELKALSYNELCSAGEAKYAIEQVIKTETPAVAHIAHHKKNIKYNAVGLTEMPHCADGYLKYVLFPLTEGETVTGVFCLFFRASEDIYSEGISLIEETARNIAFRVSYLRLEQEQKKADEQLAHLYAQLKALTARLQELREDERLSLSRQLHDELGQTLTALKIELILLQKQPASLATDRISTSIDLVNTLISSVRTISTELRPALLSQLGLLPAIKSYTHDISIRTGINISVIGDLLLSHDSERETVLYRVFQEIMTNILKHSGATEVTIELEQDNEKIEIHVSDNGCGFVEGASGSAFSLGIIGMRERLNQYGGRLHIVSEPHRGTTVHVVLPISA